MIKPISPKDVVTAKQESMPDNVIEAFNELIAEKWNGSSSTVKQADAVERIIKKFGWDKEQEDELWDDNWLDVEPIFRKAGWKVEYDKPGFNESYPATYTFKKKVTR
jgi:hypothetical protein